MNKSLKILINALILCLILSCEEDPTNSGAGLDTRGLASHAELVRGMRPDQVIARATQSPTEFYCNSHSCRDDITPTPAVLRRDQEPFLNVAWSDHRRSDEYTTFTGEHIDNYGQDLLNTVPEDIDLYCPQYRDFSREQRRDFYISFISTVARFENNSFNPSLTFREDFPDSTGNLVVSRGLLQVSLESSRGWGCPLRSANELHDASKNLECGVRILNGLMRRGNRLGSRVGGSWKGGAEYWSVLRSTHARHQQLRQEVRRNCASHESEGLMANINDNLKELFVI